MAIDRRLLTHINWGLWPPRSCCSGWHRQPVFRQRRQGGGRHQPCPYYERQMIWGAFGLIAMVACMSFDYRHLQAMALPFFLIVLFSLCLIPLFGKVI